MIGQASEFSPFSLLLHTRALCRWSLRDSRAEVIWPPRAATPGRTLEGWRAGLKGTLFHAVNVPMAAGAVMRIEQPGPLRLLLDIGAGAVFATLAAANAANRIASQDESARSHAPRHSQFCSALSRWTLSGAGDQPGSPRDGGSGASCGKRVRRCSMRGKTPSKAFAESTAPPSRSRPRLPIPQSPSFGAA